MNAPIFTSDAESRTPGSARVPRAGRVVPTRRTSSGVWSDGTRLSPSTRQEVREGGTPSPTRGTRVLPGTSAAPLRQSARAFLAALALAACAPAFTHAAELDKDDPAAELASFRLPPGFEANLFASEKDGVVKPIQMRWDTRGRLWVIQSTTYPQLVPGETPNDKVLILEDPERTGHVQKVTVFADGLMIPTGLEIAPTPAATKGKTELTELTKLGKEGTGGSVPPPNSVNSVNSVQTAPSACYVGEGTKLWLLTDTDGDGVCDRREVVLRGFGTGDNHQNINSFRWTPGGELVFSQGLHAHARVETPHGIVALDEAGFFRYRPREQRLDAFYGGQSEPQNPWGFVFTDWGQMLMVAGNNGGIYWPLPEMVRGVQRGRREQIWENARGRKCSGPDIIGTAHLPPEWQGTLLSGGYISNAVWALRVEDDGAGFRVVDREAPPEGAAPPAAAPAVARPAEAPRTDEANPAAAAPPRRTTQALVTSTHGSFRPVDVKIGPDGAIYLCDWYNPIIGHYQSSFRHPDRDKVHGRIWRITYKGRPLVTPPPIAGAPVEALLENLKSPARWVREQSKRELAGRPTEEVVKAARAWWPRVAAQADAGRDGSPSRPPGERSEAAGAAPSPTASLRSPTDGSESRPYLASEHALYEVLGVFEAQDTPEPELLEKLCASNNPNVRAYAGGLAERWSSVVPLFGGTSPFLPFTDDPSPRVRLAFAVAAGNIQREASLDVLLAINDKPRDKFIDLALKSAVTGLDRQLKARTGVMNEFPDDLKRLFETVEPALFKKLTETPPPSNHPAVKLSAIPATGKLRATPEFVAELVKEVRASGDARHGAEVFRRADIACTACHSLEDKGGKVGPPLDAIGSGQPLDFIIGAVLEPQREIKESYEAVELSAKDGRKLTGYIVARDATGVTLREPATGAETKLAPADVAAEKAIGSFMPAGLVDALPRADLRDLFRYLSELGKPR